ncbi:type IV secretion system protein VirB9 [Rhodoferax ferrireducens]|uniref:Type IV secretion system protein VirB9 n=1 Tax=Rhodoferax ferrireducens TaxID=192843 RepID=A0ABU2CGF0_9BURK|nr:TrbG/VirB9 family P-type conjugative transfer protein [Rhodoferax ferrireducens]MDR7380427.1 type IV secretion system protein VirB9 [Rhodoferax ferrireducens]
MKLFLKPLVASTMLAALSVAYGAGIPEASPNDLRIRVIPYKANDVTVIRVQRGIVTRIMLENDEKIEIPVVGLSSDCKSETDEWCISAILGSNQIFVRPRDNAGRNNMELHTSKRDYSFVFEIVDGNKVSRGKRADADVPFFRVVFDYPKPKPLTENLSGSDRAAAVDALLQRVDKSAARPIPQQVDPDFGMTPVQRLKAEGIQIRNTNYTKQVLARGEDAEPTMVFDDGRFTYFEFPGAREIPAVFAQGSDGEPTRVNWNMNGNFVVVQRTARKFTLRLGEAVVGIFNEAFDRTGIATPTSTVSPAVVREIKGAAQ